LDFINEPLKAIQSFLEPMDKSPNVLDFGSENVARAFVVDKLTDLIEQGPRTIDIQSDRIEFDILDTHFFVKGTSDPSPKFGENIQKLAAVVKGLEDSYLKIEVILYNQSVADSDPSLATIVATQRWALLRDQVKSFIDSPTVELTGGIRVTNKDDYIEGQKDRPSGLIRVRMEQKPQKESGQPFRKLEKASDRIFGSRDRSLSVYDNFVRQISEPTRAQPENKQ
jgi:chemotaxis protein MotB